MPSGPELTIRLSTGDGGHALSDARRMIRAFAGDVDDAPLVLTELLANAIAASTEQVSWTARLEPDVLLLRIVDDGPAWSTDSPLTSASDTAPGGRGLHIVDRVADDLRIDRIGERTEVRVRLPRNRTPI